MNTVRSLTAAKFVKKDTQAWFDFPELEGFKILLRYCRKSEMRKMLEDCTEKRTDLMTGETKEETNSEEFKKEICKNIIIDWAGLTIGMLKKLIPLDEAALAETGYVDTDLVACDLESKMMLMNESFTFDRWLNTAVSDIRKFKEDQQAKEAELLK